MNKLFLKQLLIIALVFTFPAVLHAEINAGIVDGLWFSKSPFFKGDVVTLFVAVHNEEAETLNGTIEFYRDSTLLGSQPTTITGFGVKISSLQITAINGSHAYSAQLKSTTQVVNGNPVLISVPSSKILTAKSVFVDDDTDGDGIGNETDTDDDGDDVSDVQEKVQGSDPLDTDTDDDGLNDFEDPTPMGSQPISSGGSVFFSGAQNILQTIQKSLETSDNPIVNNVSEAIVPASKHALGAVESAQVNVESAAQPFIESIISQIEERRKNLFDVSLSSAATEKRPLALWRTAQIYLYSAVIWYLTHWLPLTLTLIFFIVLWRWRNNRRYY